jgi:hypothetical protein
MAPIPTPSAQPAVPMQSPLAALFQRPPAGLTRENLAKDLVTPDNYELKTEVINPFASAAYDTFSLFVTGDSARTKAMLAQYGIFETVKGRITVDVLLRFYAARQRLLAISRGRMSRTELVSALKQIEFTEDKQKGKTMLEGLFGEQK